MKNNTLGSLIQEKRERQKISRKSLCQGLCTVMTLKRYELDERVPDKFMADALLERLGLNPFRYEFVVSDKEFQFSVKREKIEKLLHQGQIKEAKENLNRYEEMLQKKDFLHWQYVMLKKVEILRKEKNDAAAIPILRQALKCTQCSWVEKQSTKDILMTKIETELFYQLGELQYLAGEKEEAYACFIMLKVYMEKESWDREKWKDYYPQILYYLAKYEFEKHNLGKSYEYLNQAQKILVEYYQINNLYNVLKLKKTITLMLGIHEESNENFILALNLICMSENGKMSKKGVDLWESIVNPIL